MDRLLDFESPDWILTHTDESEKPSLAEQAMLRCELSSVCGEKADVVLNVELSIERAFVSVCGVEHISRNRCDSLSQGGNTIQRYSYCCNIPNGRVYRDLALLWPFRL